MGLQPRHEEAEGSPLLPADVVHGAVRQKIRPVAVEVHPVPVPVVHESAVPVGGELQHVRRHPIIPPAAAPFGRDRLRLEVRMVRSGGIKGILRGQMPFPHVGGLVPGAVQVIRDRRDPGGQGAVVDVASDPGGIQAGLQTGSGRSAHGLAGHCQIEAHALRRQPVDPRGQSKGRAGDLSVAADGVVPLLIGEEKYDIGSVVLHNGSSLVRFSPPSYPAVRFFARVLRDFPAEF